MPLVQTFSLANTFADEELTLFLWIYVKPGQLTNPIPQHVAIHAKKSIFTVAPTTR